MRVFIVLFGSILAVNAMQLPRPLCGCKPDLPVCASNLKTYSSECEMNCSEDGPGLQVIHRGTCDELINNNSWNINPWNNNYPWNNDYPWNNNYPWNNDPWHQNVWNDLTPPPQPLL